MRASARLTHSHTNTKWVDAIQESQGNYGSNKWALCVCADGSAVKELTRPFENAQRTSFQTAYAQKKEREKALFSSAAKNVSTRVDKSRLFRLVITLLLWVQFLECNMEGVIHVVYLTSKVTSSSLSSFLPMCVLT